MENVFKTGEYVTYGKTGVCIVDGVKSIGFSNGSLEKLYYILKPVSAKSSTVYVPVDSELARKIHHLITRDEIDELILYTKGKEIDWIENKSQRSAAFNAIISADDMQEILLLAQCIKLKKKEKSIEKKNLSDADESILKLAEKLINEEFACVLDCNENDVGTYIRKKREM